jgi:acetyltransferase-like isoleucine patch superfamily enzyme
MTPPDLPLPPEFRDGELLPRSLLERWLGSVGRDVRVYRGCRLVGPRGIHLGNATQIDEGVFVFAGEGVTIGAHVHLAFGSSISGGGSCQIGDFAGIGAGVRIITGTEDVSGDGLTNPTIPTEFRRVNRSRVVVGPHAVIFTASQILPGVTIGEGAVVAAGSLVHHDLKPWSIYAGNPLTQIGLRPRDRILELAARLHSGHSP